MRTDEGGNPCPSTLGEYYDLVLAFSAGDETCPAVEFFARKIREQGRDEEVLADDSQIRALVFPMIADWAEARARRSGA